MFDLPENTVAYCPIKAQKDYDNVCVLTSEALIITKRGSFKTYLLSNVNEIAIKHKKMLFPIVVGGIIGTLFFVALFNFVFSFWLSLSISGLGFALFYYGIQGSATISIKTRMKEYDHFIGSANQPLQLFVQFLSKEVISTNSPDLCFYLPLTRNEWNNQKDSGQIIIHDKTILLTSSQVKSDFTDVLLKIIVKKLNAKISIEIKDGTIHPVISENINLDAVELAN